MWDRNSRDLGKRGQCTHGFVGDEVFADWEAHPGTEAKRGGSRATNDAVSAHDSRSHVAQSSCHFRNLDLPVFWNETVNTYLSLALVYVQCAGLGFHDTVGSVVPVLLGRGSVYWAPKVFWVSRLHGLPYDIIVHTLIFFYLFFFFYENVFLYKKKLSIWVT